MSLFGFRRPVEHPPQPPSGTEPVVPEPVTGQENVETPLPAGTTPASGDKAIPLRQTSSRDQEYLWAHLSQLDQLVRAHTIRWQSTIAESKPSHLWGMAHVTDAEVDNFIASEYCPPDTLPADLQAQLAGHWRASDDRAREFAATRPELWHDAPHLRRLEILFGLTRFEVDALLACLLPHVDARYRRLYGYLMDDAARTRPTVELVLHILYPIEPDPAIALAYFSARAPLRANRLIVVDGGEDELPLPLRSARVDDRIVAYLLGGELPDDRLIGIMQPVPPVDWGELILPDTELDQLKGIAAWWQEQKNKLEQAKSAAELGEAHAHTHAGGTLYLRGPYGSGRLKAARAICGNTEPPTPLWVADVGAALHSPLGFREIVDLAQREALLQDAALYWAHAEALLPQETEPGAGAALKPQWEYLLAAVREFPGLAFIASENPWEPTSQFRDHTFMRLDFTLLGYELRKRIWERRLPPPEEFSEPEVDRSRVAALLANAFQLTEGQTVDAIALARDLAAARNIGDPRLKVDDLYDACRRQAGMRLAGYARRIVPRSGVGFDNLVLPPANRQQLEELRQRIRLQNRVLAELGFDRGTMLGKGLVALFTGSSGTGKTMAAELLAGEQNVDLYKADIASMLGPYVGQTEQHLKSVFDEAEGSNAILFFDEADALFSKRGEVKEARDRWANSEANYLLQRIEESTCIVILATNLKQQIDPAFIRRIHLLVEFPMPDARARYRIWLGMFPRGVERPTDEQIRGIADQFDLSGGSIRNIVIDAAFRAVVEQPPGQPLAITLRHVVLAIGREWIKLDRPFTKGAFGVDYYPIVEKEILGIAGTAA